MKGFPVIVASSLVLLSACTGPEPRETKDQESSTISVPDATHTDLRTAYQELQNRGFEIDFAQGMPRAARRYAKGQSDPDLSARLMALRPKPGTMVSEGTAVTITSVTCSAGQDYGC